MAADVPMRTSFRTLRERGWIPRAGALMAGIGPEGPIELPIGKLFPAVLLGAPETGKSFALRWLAAQAALIGCDVTIWNPKGWLDFEVGGDVAAAEKPSRVRALTHTQADGITASARSLAATLARREEGETGRPHVLFVDEWGYTARMGRTVRRVVSRLLWAGQAHGMHVALAGFRVRPEEFDPWIESLADEDRRQGWTPRQIPSLIATWWLFTLGSYAEEAAAVVPLDARTLTAARIGLSRGMAHFVRAPQPDQGTVDPVRLQIPETRAADIDSALASGA